MPQRASFKPLFETEAPFSEKYPHYVEASTPIPPFYATSKP